MYIKKNKYSKKFFLELFLLMPYQSVKVIPYVYDLIVIFKYFSLVIEILLLLKQRNRCFSDKYNFSYSEFFLLVFIFYEFYISLCFGSTTITNLMSYFVGTLLALFSLRRNIINDYERTLKTLSLYFFLAIILNFISLIIFPDGLYVSRTALGAINVNYFLGLDNAFGMMIFPGLTYICLSNELFGNQKKLFSISILFIVLITYLLVMSASGLTAIIVFIILYFIFLLNIFNKVLSMKFLFPLILVISTGLVMGNFFLFSNSFFSNYIISILGKDITFSSRTFIWEAGVKQFALSPLFGYGIASSDNIVYIWGTYRIAHNFWLQLVLEGGGVGFLLFLSFITGSIIKNDAKCKTDRRFVILNIGVFSLFVYLLMESSSAIIPVIMLFTVMNYSARNKNQYNEQ